METNEALQWEIERMRANGYTPCLVLFTNAKGHARSISTLDATALRMHLEHLATGEIETEAELGC